MPAYGVAQAGYNAPPNQGLNLTSLVPGQQVTLIDAADAVAGVFTSVAIGRGYKEAGGGATSPITFALSGAANGSVCIIEAAWQNNPPTAATDYVQVGIITGNGFYSDIGGAPFYRAVISIFEAGDVPVVTASRF